MPHQDTVVLANSACIVATMTAASTYGLWLGLCLTRGSLYLELIQQLVLKNNVELLFDVADQQLHEP